MQLGGHCASLGECGKEKAPEKHFVSSTLCSYILSVIHDYDHCYYANMGPV